MIRYGKMAQGAVAVVSRLAELHDQDRTFSSREIGAARGLPASFAAKLLSTLARHGVLVGTPGPRGGYRLARDPDQIRLADVVRVFEPQNRPLSCPYGPDWCGNGPRCPLHDKISKLEKRSDEFLEGTHFGDFAKRS